MKRYLLAVIFIIILSSCKTVVNIDKETSGNILFRNIIKKSEKISNVYISGLLRISGFPDIPSGVYISYVFHGDIKKQVGLFRLLLFKKPIYEIYFKKNDVIFLNCKASQYVKLNIDEVDYSKFIGINFNPIEIAYFLIGAIPYSEDMVLMSYDQNNKKEHELNISTSISTYDIKLNKNEDITWALLNNQYFDKIILESVKYTKNDDNINIPSTVVFKTEDGIKGLHFVIDKISLMQPFELDVDNIDFSSYTEVKSITELNLQIK